MSDPIICIECGATSYNEPGKTPIRCASCWEKLKERAEKAEARLAELEKYYDFQSSIQYKIARFNLWATNYGTYTEIDRDFHDGKLAFINGELKSLSKSTNFSGDKNWSAEEILKREG